MAIDEPAPNATVTHDAAAHRFEIPLPGEVALAEYERDGDTISFTHTVVPEAYEGHGLGSRLARAGLDYARAQGLRVAPLCPFFAVYLRRHPEDCDLVVDGFPL